MSIIDPERNFLLLHLPSASDPKLSSNLAASSAPEGKWTKFTAAAREWTNVSPLQCARAA